MRVGVEDLERQGIDVIVHPDFPLRFAEISDWYGEARDGQTPGWFTLDLGIVVGGQRISLLPVLANLIAAQPELFTPGALAELDDDELIFAALDDGRKVPLPAGRVRSILGVLVELHLRELPPGPLRLPLLDAARPILLAAPLAPCRNDGSSSNLMLGPGGRVLLVDFDRATRDPARPDRLLPAFDGGDALHPNPAGYRAMGDAVPLTLFD